MISGIFVNIKWTCSFLYILRYKATIIKFRRWTWKTNFVLSVISDKGNSKFSMPRWYWDVSGSLKYFPFYSLFVSTRSLSFLRKCHLPPLDEIFTWPSISSHLTHNNFQPKNRDKMQCHFICVCVFENSNSVTFAFKWYSYQLEYANEWDEPRKNETSFACRFYICCMLNRMPYLSTKNIFENASYNYLNSIFSKPVFIVEYSFLPIWLCGRLNTRTCPWLNLFW